VTSSIAATLAPPITEHPGLHDLTQRVIVALDDPADIDHLDTIARPRVADFWSGFGLLGRSVS
jgi:hypothetical protein